MMELRERLRLWVVAQGLCALTIATDLVPPRYRFGHWNRLLGVLSPAYDLPRLSLDDRLPAPTTKWSSAPARARLSCLIVAGDLDAGGIESMVASLARGLPSQGVDVEVVATAGGRTEAQLRAEGVRVRVLPAHGIAAHIDEIRPDVIQVHRVDPDLMSAVVAFADRVVPVFHAMESYLTRAVWEQLSALTARAPACAAVSASVRDYFARRIGASAHVIVNGVAPVAEDTALDRLRSRERIGRVIRTQLDQETVLVLALQRYSDQKNTAGLVDAFLEASEYDDRLILVVAGAPNSWLEYRRADIRRRRHPNGDRVFLLGDSDAHGLLSGADVFALDSFSEGGPIVAVEAAAHDLPVVLTDVGFARELARASTSRVTVVDRPNVDVGQRAMARERRRARQSNRSAFARALLSQVADRPRQRRAGVPAGFTEEDMVAGHAALLRAAVASRGAVATTAQDLR